MAFFGYLVVIWGYAGVRHYPCYYAGYRQVRNILCYTRRRGNFQLLPIPSVSRRPVRRKFFLFFTLNGRMIKALECCICLCVHVHNNPTQMFCM